MPAEEVEIWRKTETEEEIVELLRGLNKLKNNGFDLSSKSLELVACKNSLQQKELFLLYKVIFFSNEKVLNQLFQSLHIG